MIPYVDTHCHLDLIKDIQKNLLRENSQPIKTISVTNAPFLFEPNKSLFKDCQNIRVALGMHPEMIARFNGQFNEFEKRVDETRYIGEIGLDGSKDFEASYSLQKKLLEQILMLCKEVDNKILSVHSRNAAADTIYLLNKHLNGSRCKVILHWFSGSLLELQKAVDLGYYFSINHKMAHSHKGKQIIAIIPRHLILTETDAPFTFDKIILSRLQSLQESVKVIATTKDCSEGEMKRIIFDNFSFLLKNLKKE